MPEPALLHQQRHLLRSFRNGSALRTRAEFISEANYNAEREAAGQVQASARAEAEAQRTRAEADAQARRKSEQTSAESELRQVRQTTDQHMAEVHEAYKWSKATLDQAKLGSIVQESVSASPVIDAGSHAGQALAHAAHEATQAAKFIPGLVGALAEAQQRAQRRQQAVGMVILAIVILVGIAGLVLYNNWQRDQRIIQLQVIATAQALAAQTTATAEAVAAQATATAEAITAQTTATAQASAAQAFATAPDLMLAPLEQRTGARMIVVPAGEFLMGSSASNVGNEVRPQHTVYLNAFAIDETEVTAAQYQLCVEAGACVAPNTVAPNIAWNCTFGVAGQSDHPTNCVDWDQAAAYCQWAGKRLPTEAEWEKAARGTDGRFYPWGNQEPSCSKAQFATCEGRTAPVGLRPEGASPYGVLDMAGNVWEWVSDWYGSTYYSESPRDNPQGPTTGATRVLRGGGWEARPLGGLRTYSRLHAPQRVMSDTIGFRCAFSP